MTITEAREKRTISRLIKSALEFDYLISVHDGEEIVLHQSDHFNKVYEAIGWTETTTLIFSARDGQRLGAMWLIHGEGADVIADFEDNEAMQDLYYFTTDQDH